MEFQGLLEVGQLSISACLTRSKQCFLIVEDLAKVGDFSQSMSDHCAVFFTTMVYLSLVFLVSHSHCTDSCFPTVLINMVTRTHSSSTNFSSMTRVPLAISDVVTFLCIPVKISTAKYSCNTLKLLDCKIIATQHNLQLQYDTKSTNTCTIQEL